MSLFFSFASGESFCQEWVFLNLSSNPPLIIQNKERPRKHETGLKLYNLLVVQLIAEPPFLSFYCGFVSSVYIETVSSSGSQMGLNISSQLNILQSFSLSGNNLRSKLAETFWFLQFSKVLT